MPSEEEVQNTSPRPDMQVDETADDPLGDRLDAARKYAADAGTLEAPIVAACDALEAARSFAMKVAGTFYAQRMAESGVVAEAARSASNDPSAIAEYKRRAERGLVSRVGVQVADEAAPIASTAADKVLGCKVAIESAGVKGRGYGGLQPGGDLVTLLKQEQLNVQIRARGVQEFAEQLGAALAVNDEETVRALEDAGEGYLVEVASDVRVGTKPMRGGAVTNGGGLQSVGEDRLLAWRLLGEMKARRDARTPPEVALAREIYSSLLLPSFREVLGFSTWSIPAARMSAIYSGSGATPGELDVLENWSTRTLPDAPPGFQSLGARGSRTPTSAANPVAPSRLAMKGGR